MKQYDMIIVGGGPAGMAAAVRAWDLGIRNLILLEREPVLGGILMQCIHSGFGLHKWGEELTGPEYANLYQKMVKERGIPYLVNTTVINITPDKTVTVQNEKGLISLHAKTLILATGCRERSRGAIGLAGTRPAGIYSAGCAQKWINCMGYLVGKRVVILGSGDIGLIMARRMTLEGAKVEAVCEVLPYSGGLIRNKVQCLDDFGIPLLLSTTVSKVHGTGRLEGVTLTQVDENRNPIEGSERFVPCDTLLLSVGLIPENELALSMGLVLNPVTGGVEVDETRQSSIAGVFACGNALHVHDLVDYVSEEAEKAAEGAVGYLTDGSPEEPSLLCKAGSGIRYVLPQKIHCGKEPISLFFRITEPMNKVRFVLRSGHKTIPLGSRIKAAPGEMERVTLSPEILASLTEDAVLEAEVTQ